MEALATLGSQPVTQIIFARARTAFGRAQVWFFDSKTGLPAQIEFNLAAEIGQMRSPLRNSDSLQLSTLYQVSCIPSKCWREYQAARCPKAITVSSVGASATESSNPTAETEATMKTTRLAIYFAPDSILLRVLLFCDSASFCAFIFM